MATLIALCCAGGVWLLTPWLNDYLVVPLYLACISLPAYGLANTQDGIARSHDWVGLSLMPTYVVRQLLLTGLMAVAYLAGLPMNAETAMIKPRSRSGSPPSDSSWCSTRRLGARSRPAPARTPSAIGW